MRVVTVLGALFALAPATAWADCADPTLSCLCEGQDTVLEGIVSRLDGSATDLDVVAAWAREEDGGSGRLLDGEFTATARVAFEPSDLPGQRWLLMVREGQLIRRHPVDGDGRVVCSG